MSDEFENVSAETFEAMPSPESVQVEAPVVDQSSSEPIHADEQVYKSSADVPKTAEDLDRQEKAAESGNTLGNGNVDGRTRTDAARQANAAAAEDEKDRKLEAIKASQKDWLDKNDHDFGGIKMSGHDLAKMIDFISDPVKQKILSERLGKTNMPKEKIEKGMKELNEYLELKKKEQEGQKLTEDQQRRLKELEKSEEFKAVAASAAQQARDDGIKLSMDNSANIAIARVAVDDRVRSQAKADVVEVQASSKKLASSEFTDDTVASFEETAPSKPLAFVVASARDSLPKTVALTETFTDTIATQVANASNKPSLAMGAEEVSLTDEDPKVANTNIIPNPQQRVQAATVVASL